MKHFIFFSQYIDTYFNLNQVKYITIHIMDFTSCVLNIVIYI